MRKFLILAHFCYNWRVANQIWWILSRSLDSRETDPMRGEPKI